MKIYPILVMTEEISFKHRLYANFQNGRPYMLIGVLCHMPQYFSHVTAIAHIISCFPVGYREILVKIFLDLTLAAPVKIPISMVLLPRLIARASQPDGNMTSFTLNFSRLT